MPPDDLAMNDIVVLYYEEIVKSYREIALPFFFPEVNGKRIPLFNEESDERLELIRLREAANNVQAFLAGEAQLTPDGAMFHDNQDGAQDRFAELTAKFEEAR
ncbi:MAG: hypothetical protein NUW01_08900 [Gemmatimonadaceae bacterium]|nr:hypothetical protein [Gemmatimonadaceae bacterium]